MAITSQTEKTVGIGECLIKNWSEAGLLKPSSIKPAISTIEKKLEDMRKEGQVSTFDKLAFHLLYFSKKMKEQGDYHSSHDL